MGMVGFLRSHSISYTAKSRRPEIISIVTALSRCYHFRENPNFGRLDEMSPPVQRGFKNNVGVFWDLNNRPPKTNHMFNASNAIKAAARFFGILRHAVAYADSRAYAPAPSVVDEPYYCVCCKKRFRIYDRLVTHLKEIHEPQYMKRLNKIESARGKERVNLVGFFSFRMVKYRKAVKNILTQKERFCLADELKRAGYWVQTVPDEPEEAENAMRSHMVDLMRKGQVQCLVLISFNSSLVDVVKEARLRGVKTIVVGDSKDGGLKRTVDASFSWTGFMKGQAMKDAERIMSRWRDSHMLKRLEWTYNQEMENNTGYGTDNVAGFERI